MPFPGNSASPLGQMWSFIPAVECYGSVISDQNANTYQIAKDFYTLPGEIIALEMFANWPNSFQIILTILCMMWALINIKMETCLKLWAPSLNVLPPCYFGL